VSSKKTGFAIALAWPRTLCKQAGAWYDHPLRWIGINKDFYYRVGHAAVVLVNVSDRNCLYFDFGRYHSPHGLGRVRDATTDHDLEIKTRAIISDGRIINLVSILLELNSNNSCHGSGPLHGSYTAIDFERALHTAKKMQEQSPIPYGPFVPDGTNCSRFVNTVLLAGKPALRSMLLLRFPKTFSPTPLGNVKALKERFVIQSSFIAFSGGKPNRIPLICHEESCPA
jgi:hypothetical protein